MVQPRNNPGGNIVIPVMEAKAILEHLWSLSEGEYVFLPSKRAFWTEGGAFHVKEAVALLGVYQGAPQADQYFSPLKYLEPQRRRVYVGRPGVIFADMDDGSWLMGYEPHLIVASSNTHQHAYWFLNEPADLEAWEDKSRGLTMAIRADLGGWDSTQVLRIPGSLNHKYEPPQEVQVVEYHPDATARLSDFPSAPAHSTPHHPFAPADPPTSEVADRARILAPIIDSLSLETQALLSLTNRHTVRDRSAVVWRVGAELLEAGLSVTDTFAVIAPMWWNKYRERPEELMRGLHKQAQSHS